MLSLSSSNHLDHSSKQKIFTEEKIRIQFFHLLFRTRDFKLLCRCVCVCVHRCRTITDSFSCYTCISGDDDPFSSIQPLPSPFSTNRCSASVSLLFIFLQPHLHYVASAFSWPATSDQVFLPPFLFSIPRHCPRCCSPGANELWLISRNDVYWSVFFFFPSFFFRESAPASR